VILRSDWAGFGIQKNRALDEASGDWVFSIDADERVSTTLKEEIFTALKEPAADAYRIPDYIVWLWKRGRARFSDDIVHEHVLAAGPTGTLSAPSLAITST
jgi:glycosyltransferase involved in cell wall biosynthesis